MASENEAGRFNRIDAGEGAHPKASRQGIDSGVVAKPHFKYVAQEASAFAGMAAPPHQAGAGVAAGADPVKPALPVTCVDLDGALLATDVCAELLLLAARSRPLLLIQFVYWVLVEGRAAAKRKLAAALPVEPGPLPVREEVLHFLGQQKARGQALVLLAGSNLLVARAVAAEAGIFDDVLADEVAENFEGACTLASIRRYCEARNFDRFAYVGASGANTDVWHAAEQAYLVAPSRRLLRKVQSTHPAAAVLVPGGRSMAARLRVLRPKQWVKNLLLFVPLLLAHRVGDFGGLWKCCLSFIAFSAIASAIYVVNDLADLAADRLHPHKRRRPFAAGTLPLREGPWLAGLLLAASLGISLAALPAGLTALLVLYLVLTMLYSFWLKRMVVVDVIFLAAFYTLRVIAGGVATGVPVSEWLLVFSMFLFLSLAFAKRYVELARACDSGAMDLNRRSYLPSDLGLIESLGPNSGYLAVLVLALYVNSDHTRQLYPRVSLLWLLCPLLLYWITRTWFLAQRRALSEDPVTYAVHDTVSWATAAAAMVIVLAAAAA
jgi:4-hydroxybenzoate polyprenyltransferase